MRIQATTKRGERRTVQPVAVADGTDSKSDAQAKLKKTTSVEREDLELGQLAKAIAGKKLDAAQETLTKKAGLGTADDAGEVDKVRAMAICCHLVINASCVTVLGGLTDVKC